MDWVRRFLTPCPSFFDLLVSGLVFVIYFKNPLNQALFFVNYSILIFLVTLFMKPKRQYRNVFLYALGIWSLLSVFIHQRVIVVPDCVINAYFNKSFMSEGFLYVLTGILVIRSIVMYGKNMNFIYIFALVAYLSFLPAMQYRGSMTPMMAIFVSVAVWGLLQKKFVHNLIGIGLSIIGASVAYMNWTWLSLKFRCRPDVWAYLWNDMWKLDTSFYSRNPIYIFNEYIPMQIAEKIHWVFGNGFCKFLWGNMVSMPEKGWNWLYRQNDILSFGNYLGVPALILLTFFILSSLKVIGKKPALIGFLAIVIICWFQMTMFYPDKGALCLLVGSICIKNSMEERNEV